MTCKQAYFAVFLNLFSESCDKLAENSVDNSDKQEILNQLNGFAAAKQLHWFLYMEWTI